MSDSLLIEHIRLRDFRNYKTLEVEPSPTTTVFIGPNATGKTNAVEAVSLLCAHASFRGARSTDLIRHGAAGARVEGNLVSLSRNLQAAAVFEPHKRSFSLNGKGRSAYDMQALVPVVAFTPDDLQLAKDASAPRRSAVDALGCQLARAHRVIKRDYEKLVRHKNALLKDSVPDLYLDAVDDALLPAAAKLFEYRQALFAKLSGYIASAYERISGGEQLQATYIPSWESNSVKELAAESPIFVEVSQDDIRRHLEQALTSRRADEVARKRCLIGPHADHVEIFINGGNVRTLASQGQQRSVALAWKMAEVQLISDTTGKNPVLLLDDVLSELDASRRAALASLLSCGSQTFVTATDLSRFDEEALHDAYVIDLSKRGERA